MVCMYICVYVYTFVRYCYPKLVSTTKQIGEKSVEGLIERVEQPTQTKNLDIHCSSARDVSVLTIFRNQTKNEGEQKGVGGRMLSDVRCQGNGTWFNLNWKDLLHTLQVASSSMHRHVEQQK